MNQGKRWSSRAFVSLNMMLSFVVLILSSVVLYIMPPGRDAYWTQWRFWGLDKDQWDAVHTVGGFAFLIFGILHLFVYNWKTFWNYVVSKLRKTMNRKVEVALAVVLNVLLVVVCVADWFPSSTIMGWMTSIKASWVGPGQRAPYGHAEAETLETLALRSNIDLEAALKGLAEQGLTIDPTKTIQYLASQNGRTPAEFFELLAPYARTPQGGKSAALGIGEGAAKPGVQQGGGWGRRTVADIAREAGLEVKAALEKLKAAGIEAKGDSTLRDLSGKSGRTPTEIATIIRD